MEHVVPQSHVGLLYEDGVFIRRLDPGRYTYKAPLFGRGVMRRVETVDLRERSLTLKGQEILTKDKVAVRVSVLVYFRVTDPEAALHNVASYQDRIYEDAQLAARRFLASRVLDAILSDRNEISDAVREAVREPAQRYGVEILRADVKDLVFPGNLRAIMNQVLETERRAEAKLIDARKDIETRELRARAAEAETKARLESEREQLALKLEAQRARQATQLEQLKAELAAQVEVAKAVADNPELLRLKELEALEAMAASGGRFILGTDGVPRLVTHEA
jgi:regulator of protease activity HflC (stomatin/prohibitin superfamily)